MKERGSFNEQFQVVRILGPLANLKLGAPRSPAIHHSTIEVALQ